VPEGHSLVLAARRIEPVVGQHVTAGLLAGTDVAAVETRGKHLLVHGDDGRSLHVHLGMNGRVRLTEAGASLLGLGVGLRYYLGNIHNGAEAWRATAERMRDQASRKLIRILGPAP
jgi:formamidopyrimidine-DNA glycosylase